MARGQEQFFGLDLTASEQRPSAYALLGPGARLLDLDVLGSDADILAYLRQSRPGLVAIDAPLSLPRGLHCVESREVCPCEDVRQGRDCEQKLAELGIGCYRTNKNTIIRAMVKRAIPLSRDIAALGLKVLEVYPYASRVRLCLWQKGMKKTTQKGLSFYRESLAPLIPGLDPQRLTTHDHCDATVAAYTAYLHSQGQALPLGDKDEGQIYMPAGAGPLLKLPMR